jgi:hypothetical protein
MAVFTALNRDCREGVAVSRQLCVTFLLGKPSQTRFHRRELYNEYDDYVN